MSDDDFKALKEAVQQLTQQHAEDQKQRAEDQQKMQQLQDKLNEALKARAAPPAGEAVTGEQFNSLKSAVEKLSEQVAAPPSGPFALQDFMIVGDAETQFAKIQGQHGGFALFDFAPIFLLRASDKVLVEAGFDINLVDNAQDNNTPGASTALTLSFAQVDYVLNQYATLISGYMLLPLGTYSERNAGWLNKFPDDPFVRDFILPGAGAGAQVRGVVPLNAPGETLAYSAYVVNGPSSSVSTGAPAGSLDLAGNVGVLNNGKFANLHASPSAGGRAGWFMPWQGHDHYDLELGVSGQDGVWNNANNESWAAAVGDAALHLGPYFEAKGEYVNTWVETTDLGHIYPHGWWLQVGYKLAGLDLDLPLINDVELVSRYDEIRDGLGMRTQRYSFGYVYYITNTLHFVGDYEVINGNSQATIPSANQLILQLTYGF
ncbi:MAG: hypothetical protein ACLQVA_04850 [Candidatus Brocadiia bacterium]